MLHLILGKSGTGKSRWCLDRAAELAHAGTRSVLVVPEQAVYTFERETVSRLEGTLAGLVQVKSFKRLCRDILNECGGCASVRLDAAQKNVLVRQAVLECGSGLVYYRRRARDSSFYEMLCSLFDELRNAGADSEKLRQIASSGTSALTEVKFREISDILEKYEKILSSGYFDDAGELAHAGQVLPSSAGMKGVSVFFDGFSGFTQAEYGFLSSVLKTAGDVYITLGCSDPVRESGSATAVCCRTYERLKAISFSLSGAAPREIRLSTQHRMVSPGIEDAGEWFGFSGTGSGSSGGVVLLHGRDMYDEAERAADEMVRLVREEGYRFSDISVSVRDTEGYRHPLCRTLEKFGIPYYFDVSDTLECSPVTVFLDAAIELAGGIRTQALLRLLKSGLCGLSEEEISLLENYCFVHSLDRGSWYQPFTLNPSGLGEMSSGDEKVLALTEQVRQKVMAWAGDYARGSSGLRGGALLKRAYGLMEECGAADAAAEKSEPGRKNAGLAFAMVDRLYRLLGDSDASREELRSMLRLLACSTKAAEIPPVLDCVTVCDAARSIPFNPRAMFVMGLNDGVFPKDDFSGLLFTLEERDLLLENEIRLAGCFDECCDMEAYYLYRAVTAPSHRLYLSWADGNGSETLRRSTELNAYVSVFHPLMREDDGCRMVVNTATAADAYAAAAAEGDSLFRSAELQSGAAEECRRLDERLADVSFSLSGGNASMLTGSTMRLSASRIEEFENCRFKYFLHYMMNIDPIKKAEMSPIEAGNFVHAVMERLLLQCEGDLTVFTEEEIAGRVNRLSAEYCDELLSAEQRTPRMLALTAQIREGTLRLALRIRAEQEQSSFRVTDCELAIGGKDGDIEPVVYRLPDGGQAVLEGKIDRVDRFVSADRCYVRVVDYKTGNKVFKLDEVLQGINIQMLLYLFALCRNGSGRYGSELIPAGVLYMPGDPSVSSTKEDADRIYRMSGLLLDEPEVLEAMESSGSGVYIAPRRNSKGEWKYGCRLSADLIEALEKRIDSLVIDMAVSVRKGDIPARPAARNGEPKPCGYCDYRAICRQDRIKDYRELRDIEDVRAELTGEESDG